VERNVPGEAPLLDSAEAVSRMLGAGEESAPAPRCIAIADWLDAFPEADEESFHLAEKLSLPLAAVERIAIPAGIRALLAPEVARRLRAIPLATHGRRVAIAMENPADRDALETLGFLLPQRVVPVVASQHGIRDGIQRCYDLAEDEAMAAQLGIDLHLRPGATSSREMERLAGEAPVVRVIDQLLADAVSRRASDIHFRPGEQGLDVLFRIGDEVVPVRRLMAPLQPARVSRVKVLGAMYLAEHRRPQDGRSTFLAADGREVDMRVSVMPAVHGESVVIRLLETDLAQWNIGQIGLTPFDRKRMDDIMARSHGMFLATGPTGCGKSTTLYAMLLELRKQRINILTIEDPVEMYIDDIQQMQVNRAAGFGFAGALRNFLRHDPDVIMVGEVRDRETAATCVESALTGHLVLSTLHTNTAATTVTRLLDLGVEAYLLRASLLAVISQRLVRLTCTHCREPEHVDASIREALDVWPDEVFYTGRGCSHCEGLGVHKRQAVYELMLMSPRLRALVVPGASADLIHETAIAEGMVPITRAAVAMARLGLISLTEAWRVRAD